MKHIICSIFICFSLGLFSQTIDRVEAIVGDEIILKSEIENQYLVYLSENVERDSNLRCQVIEELLFQKLLIHRAQIDSVEVKEEEVSQEIERRLDYYIRQIGSVEKVETYFKKDINDIKLELQDLIRDQLLSQRVQSSITRDVKVTPSEIKEFYDNLDSLEIPKIDMQVIMQQIVIKPDISNEETNIIRNRLNDFRERVNNGEDFQVLATLYSDDLPSAKNGGDLGFVRRGEFVPEFENAAFRLKENEVSQVIKTKYGYHIIQLIERRGEQIKVCHILLKPKVSSSALLEAKTKLEEVESKIKDNIVSFQDAVKEYSQDETKNNDGLIVNPMTGTSYYTMDQLDPSLRYIVGNMNQGDLSSPIKIQQEDGSEAYRLIFLKEKKEEHIANLADDYEVIQKGTMNMKKQEEINKWISRYIKETYIYLTNNIDSCKLDFKWKR